MFSGIVHGSYEIVKIDITDQDYAQLGIVLPTELLEGLEIGASVSVDGVCLTVRKILPEYVLFDVIKSTIARTIISDYKSGQKVNIERSLKMNSENGGHEVSGHVDNFATVHSIEKVPGNCCIYFKLESKWGRYMFPQGFVSINGVSLTISDCLEAGSLFSVWLIPETLERTNLSSLTVGSKVNIEIHRGVQVVVDTISESINRFLESAMENGSLSPSFLNEIGRLVGNPLKLE